MLKGMVLLLLAGLSIATAAQAADAPRPQEVNIDTGTLRGRAGGGVIAFKGVPYARPPVGALRWRAPQAVRPWSGVRDAGGYGADCMQAPMDGDAAPLGVAPAEDCLYLNVWRPAQSGAAPLPVMVWLYGGGFVNGGSSPSVYDGSGFARKGVILVSLNYRLGRFGFFAHPALTAARGDDALGNYGYMDQLAALHWIQRNIGAFGGDPHNVTLFGESAGGASVLAMMTTPLAQGLFQKAIVESGGGRGPLLPMRDMGTDKPGLPSAESAGLAFARRVGVDGTDAAALERLRALPAEQIVGGLNMGTMSDPAYAGGPVRDGVIVTDTPDAVIARGAQLKVPVMIGATSADLSLVPAGSREALFALFGAQAARAQALYDPSGKTDAWTLAGVIGADRTMVEPARQVARLVAAQGLPAWIFRFSYVAESLRQDGRGATHSSEIPYVFDTLQARYGSRITDADEAAAQAALGYWVAFAKQGDPNVQGLPHWPRASATNDFLLDFTNGGPVPGADPWKARLDLIEESAGQVP